jgi:hypothetical protein
VLFTVVTRTRYRSPGSVITTIAGVIAAIIIIGIVLVLIKANQNNEIVDFILDVGRFLTRPFRDLFPQDDPRQDILVNWGIAAIVYLILGALLARLARR